MDRPSIASSFTTGGRLANSSTGRCPCSGRDATHRRRGCGAPGDEWVRRRQGVVISRDVLADNCFINLSTPVPRRKQSHSPLRLALAITNPSPLKALRHPAGAFWSPGTTNFLTPTPISSKPRASISTSQRHSGSALHVLPTCSASWAEQKQLAENAERFRRKTIGICGFRGTIATTLNSLSTLDLYKNAVDGILKEWYPIDSR
jgi:hypothetical protein